MSSLMEIATEPSWILKAVSSSDSDSTDSDIISTSASSSSAPQQWSRQLLFGNTILSICVLIICFVLTLLATLMPYLMMRQEQFRRWQIRTLSCWHAFIAGVLLAAAWVVFLPNMILVAERMDLPSTSFPFILLFLSLLLPLLLDKFMLWMVATKRARPETDSRGDGAQTPSSVPTTPMQRIPGSTPSSRKPSVMGGTGVVLSGGGGLGGEFDERKMMQQVGAMGSSRQSRLSSRAGLDSESTPLTGDIESGSTTPSYGTHARLSVDALEFKAKQPFIARCAFCKENITNQKGLAYHAAGCKLKSFHAFSFSSRWMQGLRGDRSVQREIVMQDEEDSATHTERTYVGWTLAMYLIVLCAYNIALAGGINFQQTGRLVAEKHGARDLPSLDADTWIGEIAHIVLVGLVLFCFTWFYGFSLGMMLRLHRITLTNWRSWCAILIYAVSLPGAIILNYCISIHLPSKSVGLHSSYEMYLLICQCGCVGVLIYCSFLDMILEEWARSDAIWGKTISFAIGAAAVCTVAIWAPL